MKIKYISLKLLLAVTLMLPSTACDKEEESFTQISGVVYDKGNPNQTVANAQVFFEWLEPLTYGAFTHHIDSTRSDAQGRYSLSAETPNEDLHVYANGLAHFPEGALPWVLTYNAVKRKLKT